MKSPPVLLLQSLILLLTFAGAQPPPGSTNSSDYDDRGLNPRSALSFAALILAAFLMGIFSIYARHCCGVPSASVDGSMRSRRGLDKVVLAAFPTFTYAEVKEHKIGKSVLECAVCLSEFEDDETLRLIPICDHVFHPECVDAWLGSHVTCPVCRANLNPQTGDEPVLADRTSISERTNSGTGQIAIQIGGDGGTNGSPGFALPSRVWSDRTTTARVVALDKFRSHSTGHSLVRPVEDLDRFTLKLPNTVLKEMIDRTG